MRTRLRLLILSGLLAATAAGPARAQLRPELPERSRIRITVVRAEPTGDTKEALRGTAIVHRADADSIAFRFDRTDEVLIAPWKHVQRLEVSTGMRPYSIGEHLGSTALFTLVGAGAGYATWHSCNDPESDEIWSCILSPRRLGTSVRAGAWLGVVLGLGGVVANRETERWRNVLGPSGPTPLIGYSPRDGISIGLSLRF